MNEENQPLVTDELVEFEKNWVEVQDFKKTSNHFIGIYKAYFNSSKKNQKNTTCNCLDLGTPRS